MLRGWCFQEFGKRVRRRMRDIGDDGDKKVLSVHLTFREPLDLTTIYDNPMKLANRLAREGGAGLWLALEFGETNLRPHWHGLALTQKPESWFKGVWSDLAAAKAEVKVVTGQEGERDDLDKNEFRQNLNRVIHYALKTQSVPIEPPLEAWIVASGCLREDWLLATGVPVVKPGTEIVCESPTPTFEPNAEPVNPSMVLPGRSQEGIPPMKDQQSSDDRGHVLRDCRNHERCHGVIFSLTQTGRKTRKDCQLCDTCADEQSKDFDHLGDGHRQRSSKPRECRDGGIDGLVWDD